MRNGINNSGTTENNGSQLINSNENDLDGLMKNLGLDVMNAKRAVERVPMIPNYSDLHQSIHQNDNGYVMNSDQNNLMMSDETMQWSLSLTDTCTIVINICVIGINIKTTEKSALKLNTWEQKI